MRKQIKNSRNEGRRSLHQGWKKDATVRFSEKEETRWAIEAAK
jgi:hypothetical protein